MNEEIEAINNRFQVKNAIRLVLGGWLFDGGDVEQVPAFLEEIADDYREEIKKNIDK